MCRDSVAWRYIACAVSESAELVVLEWVPRWAICIDIQYAENGCSRVRAAAHELAARSVTLAVRFEPSRHSSTISRVGVKDVEKSSKCNLIHL